jgi:hypothetical protein
MILYVKPLDATQRKERMREMKATQREERIRERKGRQPSGCVS